MKRPVYVVNQRNLKATGNMVSMSDFDDWIEAKVDATLAGGDGVHSAYQSVAWLFRGVSLIAQAVASLPFVIDAYPSAGPEQAPKKAGKKSATVKSDSEVDNSTDYKNAVGFLPHPKKLLKLIAACIVLTGRAYLRKEANRFAQVKQTYSGLRWYNPYTIKPEIDEEKGLIGFTRKVNGKEVKIALDQLVYLWEEDPFVEVGPPTTSAAQAALAAAGVLMSLDQFVQAFFERGAIKATILTIEGNPPSGEKERIEAWWQRFVKGMKNAFASKVFSAMVKPVVVGEGVKELENQELTTAKREDIATAIGVPQSLLFSNATNFATAQQDDLHFYSKTIIPLAELIESTLNEQLLMPLGYRIKFLPDTLDAFQEDETERAQALASLVSALGERNRGVALEMLGFELPEGYEYEDFNEGGKMNPKPEPVPALLPGQGNPAQGKEQQPTAEQKAVERLQYKAFNRRNPKRAFRFEHLDALEQADLIAEAHQENWRDGAQGRFEKAMTKFEEAIANEQATR